MKRIVAVVWADDNPSVQYVLRWQPWITGQRKAAMEWAVSLPIKVAHDALIAIGRCFNISEGAI